MDSNMYKTGTGSDMHTTAINYSDHPSEFMETYRPTQVSRSLSNDQVDKLQRNMMRRIQFCTKHTNSEFEYFCIDHDDICCKECFSTDHSTCLNFLPIDRASVGTKLSHVFTDLSKRLKEIMKILSTAEERANIENIDDNASESIPKVSKTNEKLVRYTGGGEHVVLSDLDSKSAKNTIFYHKLEPDSTRALLSRTKEQSDMFDSVEKHGSDKQAFILVHLCKNGVAELERQVKNKKQTSKVHKLSLKRLSLKRNKPTDSVMSVAEIKSDATPDNLIPVQNIRFPNSDKTRTFPPMDARHKGSNVNQLQYHVDGNKISFTFYCDIDLMKAKMFSVYGMTVTENNMLLLCDSSHSRILVCDHNDVFQCQINTRYDPWDITSIPGTHVAVMSSTHDDHVIQFIDIKKKSFLKDTRLKRSDQGGIAIADKAIFVGSENKVQVLDQKGHKIRTLMGITDKTYYIHTCEKGNMILITCQDVISIMPDGMVVFSYNSPSLQCPGKPVTDYDGNVYIPGLFSHNIHKLSPDGTFITEILGEKDDIHFPTAVCFDRNYTKFYVANNSGNSVKVFLVTK